MNYFVHNFSLCLEMNNNLAWHYVCFEWQKLFKQVKVQGTVQNKGWILENIDYKDASVPEQLRIRGFRINKIEQLEKNYSELGKFSLEAWEWAYPESLIVSLLKPEIKLCFVLWIMILMYFIQLM